MFFSVLVAASLLQVDTQSIVLSSLGLVRENSFNDVTAVITAVESCPVSFESCCFLHIFSVIVQVEITAVGSELFGGMNMTAF